MALLKEDQAPTEIGWNESALARDLRFLLARVNADSLVRANRALQTVGLKVRSYSVLSVVCDDLRPTQRDLAEFLRLDPSQVVTLIDELETKGLVERQTDPRDRRSKVVTPTQLGRRRLQEAANLVDESQVHMRETISDAEMKELNRILHKLAF